MTTLGNGGGGGGAPDFPAPGSGGAAGTALVDTPCVIAACAGTALLLLVPGTGPGTGAAVSGSGAAGGGATCSSAASMPTNAETTSQYAACEYCMRLMRTVAMEVDAGRVSRSTKSSARQRSAHRCGWLNMCSRTSSPHCAWQTCTQEMMLSTAFITCSAAGVSPCSRNSCKACAIRRPAPIHPPKAPKGENIYWTCQNVRYILPALAGSVVRAAARVIAKFR